MPVTMEQVRKALDPDEPDYPKAARLGPDALPHLDKLISGRDPGLASKAASLAGLIKDDRAGPVLEKAARSKDARVRVAAAGSAGNLPAPAASRVLAALVTDDDVGVQKVALRSVPREATPELRTSVEAVSKSRKNVAIQDLSKEVLARLSR
jgi:HEAT repeat protein